MLDSARSPAESSGFSKKIAATIIIVYTVSYSYPNNLDNTYWI